jgi:hypothetical protein
MRRRTLLVALAGLAVVVAVGAVVLSGLAVVLAARAIVTGCGYMALTEVWTDVTRDPSFGNFAPVMGNWKTRVPIRLVHHNEKDLYLVCENSSLNGKDLAALPPGTEIRIDRLEFRETFEVHYLRAKGSLTTGPYAGRTMVLDYALFANGVVDRAYGRRGDKEVKEMAWAVDSAKLAR